MRCSAIAAALLLSLLLTGPARAATPAEEPPSDSPATASTSPGRFVLFPPDDLYPRYLADPHAPATSLLVQSFSSTAIEGAESRRYHIKFGGIFPVVRWQPGGAEGRRWQFRIEAGIDAQFDIENNADNTGWDGNYGFFLTTDHPDQALVWKVGIFHTSAHIGDEWIERTGRERIGYTREELQLAVARRWGGGRRAYLEAAWGYDLLTEELMDPARLQAGVEREGSRRFGKNQDFGWYAALDLSAWEERDWRLDVGAQIGFVASPHGRAWRFGLQYWDGRVPLGEFFADTESNLTIGLWTEL